MKKSLLTIALSAMTFITAYGQEALWSGSQVTSPVVNADGTVTFNVVAPQAKKVEVSGDFLAPVEVDTPFGKSTQPGKAELKQNNGVWTFTSQKLLPELYSYNVIIDGMSILDPSNVYVNRDIASLTSIFIVTEKKGDKGDIYQVNEVPHGDVAKVWYDSPTLKMQRRLTVYTPAG